eukprot:GHVT01065272.1.p1 GENE.GHVT01065272.1~~GHVT01065272.1.p1  ORF type:complete len:155 (-),score=8.17 GHVT01065272.1:1058-1522(-)
MHHILSFVCLMLSTQLSVDLRIFCRLCAAVELSGAALAASHLAVRSNSVRQRCRPSIIWHIAAAIALTGRLLVPSYLVFRVAQSVAYLSKPVGHEVFLTWMSSSVSLIGLNYLLWRRCRANAAAERLKEKCRHQGNALTSKELNMKHQNPQRMF